MKRLFAACACVLMLPLAACTTHIRFSPHSTTFRPAKAPVRLGVNYAPETLETLCEYKTGRTLDLERYKVYAGEALEAEVVSRLRPLVESLERCESPLPKAEISPELVLELQMKDFSFEEGAARARVRAVLRAAGGAVLLDREYPGIGSPQIAKVGPDSPRLEIALHETTREAFGQAVGRLASDLKPFLAGVQTIPPVPSAQNPSAQTPDRAPNFTPAAP